MLKAFTTTAMLLVLSGAANAQSASAPGTSTQSQASAVSPTAGTALDRSALAGNWRVSKLMGMAVYNQANEKLGDVNEVIIDRTGKVGAVVIGVGGFLGMGEHDVAVSMSQLAITDDGRSSVSTNTPGSAVTVGTTPSGKIPSQSASPSDWVPDRIVLNATKDQLKSMKQFKYSD